MENVRKEKFINTPRPKKKNYNKKKAALERAKEQGEKLNTTKQLIQNWFAIEKERYNSLQPMCIFVLTFSSTFHKVKYTPMIASSYDLPLQEKQYKQRQQQN